MHTGSGVNLEEPSCSTCKWCDDSSSILWRCKKRSLPFQDPKRGIPITYDLYLPEECTCDEWEGR